MKKRPDIRLIYAQDCSGGIGYDGGIPWHLKADLKHFKELTNYSVVLMGSKTWESLPREFRPLKNRTNLVASRKRLHFTKDEDEVFFINMKQPIESILEFLSVFKEPIWIIGGAYLIDLFKPYANTIERTLVYGSYKCDTFVKPIYLNNWDLLKKETHIEKNILFEFETYKRK